jgi:4-hydroxy-tetrahydrodipicolinate synthase
MSIGGRGVVSVVGNIVPRDMKAMLAAWESGKLADAIKWHYKLFSLCRDMLGIATNPIPIKTAMKMLGRDIGELRLPMCPMEPAQDAKLRQTLTAYGLL